MVKGLEQLRIILSLLFVVASFSLYAKNEGIKIYGTYKVNGGNTSGVQIRLLRNGINEANNNSGNGKFEYDLQFNNQYELSFSKSGYITKKVVVSTDVPERVLESNSDFPAFKIKVELFPAVEGGDYSIFDEPVAMVIYDKELDDFDFDRAYNSEVEERIKKVEAKIMSAPVALKVDINAKRYDELIAKADKEFDAKSYTNARKTYQKALNVKPQENYPQIRTDLIDKILADLKKREQQKKQNDSYHALVDKADVLLEEKKYSQARSYYVEASEIKPNQQYPKDKIKLIDQIFAQRETEQQNYDNAVALGDRYFQEKKYKPSRDAYEKALSMRKDENYPKEQISRIERLLAELKSEEEKNNGYNEAITNGDNLFAVKNWADAQDAYQKAADLRPKKRYPKDKIKEIEKILQTEQKNLDAYTAALNRADKYFTEEQWEHAKQYYRKALNVKPEEAYPTEQIKKIEDALVSIATQKANKKAYDEAIAKGDRAFKSEDWVEAKDAYFDALKVQPQESYPKERIKIAEEKLTDLATKKAEENRYNNKLKQADSFYDQKQWNDAIAQYNIAAEMKPSENYPKAQVKKIERFLKEELERKTAQELEDSYNKLITEADQAFETENWEEALGSYEGALQIKPQSTYPKKRINAISQRIKEVAKEKEIQEKYDTAIIEADALYKKSKWLAAIAMYEKALSQKSQDSYAKEQISKIKATLSAEELAKEQAWKAAEQEKIRKGYNDAIAIADKELAEKRYAFAKQGYRKALTMLPDKQYPKDKLQEIADIFAQQQEADRQYYKMLNSKNIDTARYYKKLNPTENTEKRYVKAIDATKTDEIKYNKLIQKAEKEEAAGNIPFAKAYYKQAYLEKPSAQLLAKLKELFNRTQALKNKK